MRSFRNFRVNNLCRRTPHQHLLANTIQHVRAQQAASVPQSTLAGLTLQKRRTSPPAVCITPSLVYTSTRKSQLYGHIYFIKHGGGGITTEAARPNSPPPSPPSSPSSCRGVRNGRETVVRWWTKWSIKLTRQQNSLIYVFSITSESIR